MNKDDFEDGLEALYKKLGAATKRLDEPDTKEILKEIKEMENKIESSTSGEGPNPTTILPQWSVSGKKVLTMKIKKRRIDIDPMGF